MIERWSWLGEPLAIDFANTVRRRGLEYVEFLDSPRDLVEWARYERLRLRERDVGAHLDEVRELRDAVFALLGSASTPRATPPPATTPHEAEKARPSAATPRPSGATSRSDAEERLNAALAAAPLIPQLRDGDVVLTVRSGAPALDRLLACVAASTLDVLPDPALSFCDAPSCGQFYLRHRGDQRWCGPACGTRARVARHAAHHR